MTEATRKAKEGALERLVDLISAIKEELGESVPGTKEFAALVRELNAANNAQRSAYIALAA